MRLDNSNKIVIKTIVNFYFIINYYKTFINMFARSLESLLCDQNGQIWKNFIMKILVTEKSF